MEKKEVIEAIEFLRKYKTETDRIEIKTAAVDFPKKCYDTLSSFSNKSGGIIIFGLSEDNNFSVEGVYDLHDLQEKTSNLCSDAMEPSIRFEAIPMEYEGKNILAVKVEELDQSRKPCYYKPKGLKNGAYTRIGDRDDLMTDYEIYAIQSYKEHIIEDKRPNKSLSLEDLKENDLKKYLNKVIINKPSFAKNSYEKNLKLCGIIDENKNDIYPTLAGLYFLENIHKLIIHNFLLLVQSFLV